MEAIAALKSAIETHMGEREQMTTRLAELEGQSGELGVVRGDLELVRAALAEKDVLASTASSELEAIRGSLSATLAAYRSSVQAQVPSAAELIGGDTVEAINASLVTAKGVVARIEESVRAGASAGIPSGAPARTGADVEAMSPAEKIRAGLRK